eukprot:1114969-Rhodomonas_salina.2
MADTSTYQVLVNLHKRGRVAVRRYKPTHERHQRMRDVEPGPDILCGDIRGFRKFARYLQCGLRRRRSVSCALDRVSSNHVTKLLTME